MSTSSAQLAIIRKELEEYYYLRLGSQMSPKSFSEMVKAVKEDRVRFTEEGCGLILDLVVRYYSRVDVSKPNISLVEKDYKILEHFRSFLELVPAMASVIVDRGPGWVKKSLPLRAFFQQAAPIFSTTAAQFVRTVVEICPGFAEWSDFVEDSHDKVSEALREALKGVTPADRLPEMVDLQERQDKVDQQFLLGSLGPDLGAEKDYSVLDRIARHAQEQRDEILDKGEKLALKSIKTAYQRLQNELVQHTDQLYDAHQFLIKEIDNLVQIQRVRRQKKMQRFRERIKFVNERLSKTTEESSRGVLKSYSDNLNLQNQTIDVLENLYMRLAESGHLANVTQELCFIDKQLSNLCDISISIVAFGLVKVGKSTIVNCLIGENLSPYRGSVMTSIPTRFVHDLNATQPVMIVPFADELNQVVQKLRELIPVSNTREFQDLLRTDHQILLNKIAAGLRFLSKYEGVAAIVESSTCIHDLFRLAVNDIFNGELVSELPLDWSQGLDSYLTVYLKFPSADLTAGLVTFSVIDTPGIDEAEVKKLNLHKTVADAHSVSNFAVLVVPNDGTIQAEGYTPIKEMLGNIRQKYNTPLMVLATRTDTKPKETLKRQEEIAVTLSLDQVSTVSPREVFLVSGLKMFVGTAIRQLLSKHAKKPNPSSLDEPTKRLIEEFDYVVKETSYAEMDEEELNQRAEKIVKSSSMPAAIDFMMNTSVAEGIPILINATHQKVQERIGLFLATLNGLASKETLDSTREDCNKEWDNLSTIVEEIKSELDEKKNAITQNLQDIKKQIQRFLANFLTNPLDAKKMNSPKKNNIESSLFFQFSSIADEKVQNLAFSDKKSDFPDNATAQKAIVDLSKCFKKAIEEYLSAPYDRVPESLNKWSEAKKGAIEEKLAHIRAIFQRRVGVVLPRFFNGQVDDIFDHDISPSLLAGSAQVVQSSNFFSSIFSTLSRLLGFRTVLEPSAVRKLIVEQSEATVARVYELISKRIDHLFNELKNSFVREIEQEIRGISEFADSKLWELTLATAVARDPNLSRRNLGSTTTTQISKPQATENITEALRRLDAVVAKLPRREK